MNNLSKILFLFTSLSHLSKDASYASSHRTLEKDASCASSHHILESDSLQALPQKKSNKRHRKAVDDERYSVSVHNNQRDDSSMLGLLNDLVNEDPFSSSSSSSSSINLDLNRPYHPVGYYEGNSNDTDNVNKRVRFNSDEDFNSHYEGDDHLSLFSWGTSYTDNIPTTKNQNTMHQLATMHRQPTHFGDELDLEELAKENINVSEEDSESSENEGRDDKSELIEGSCAFSVLASLAESRSFMPSLPGSLSHISYGHTINTNGDTSMARFLTESQLHDHFNDVSKREDERSVDDSDHMDEGCDDISFLSDLDNDFDCFDQFDANDCNPIDLSVYSVITTDYLYNQYSDSADFQPKRISQDKFKTITSVINDLVVTFDQEEKDLNITASSSINKKLTPTAVTNKLVENGENDVAYQVVRRYFVIIYKLSKKKYILDALKEEAQRAFIERYRNLVKTKEMNRPKIIRDTFEALVHKHKQKNPHSTINIGPNDVYDDLDQQYKTSDAGIQITKQHISSFFKSLWKSRNNSSSRVIDLLSQAGKEALSNYYMNKEQNKHQKTSGLSIKEALDNWISQHKSHPEPNDLHLMLLKNNTPVSLDSITSWLKKFRDDLLSGKNSYHLSDTAIESFKKKVQYKKNKREHYNDIADAFLTYYQGGATQYPQPGDLFKIIKEDSSLSKDIDINAIEQWIQSTYWWIKDNNPQNTSESIAISTPLGRPDLTQPVIEAFRHLQATHKILTSTNAPQDPKIVNQWIAEAYMELYEDKQRKKHPSPKDIVQKVNEELRTQGLTDQAIKTQRVRNWLGESRNSININFNKETGQLNKNDCQREDLANAPQLVLALIDRFQSTTNEKKNREIRNNKIEQIFQTLYPQKKKQWERQAHAVNDIFDSLKASQGEITDDTFINSDHIKQWFDARFFHSNHPKKNHSNLNPIQQQLQEFFEAIRKGTSKNKGRKDPK